MPSKLQVKLLSNSGELLNVINCPAGRVCVFRGNTPADLRPYQRALIGTHGKEKLSVNVDGSDYDPEHHNVIGLGEAAPHAGLIVREFLAKSGVSDASLSTLLSSYGLEGTEDLRCSALSPDQERRVRILFAISQPEKALIINEPFEHITSQWKERFAELLLDFARLKGGLVVIPSLSFRPECWIDNSLISRLEVGQSIQRTIGFGSAGSQSNEMIEELRRKLREDEEEDDDDDEAERSQAPLSAAAAMGAIGVRDVEKSASSDMALIKSWLASSDSLTFKIVSSVLAAAVGVGGALVVMQIVTEPQDSKKPVVVAVAHPPQPPANKQNEEKKTRLDAALTDAQKEASSVAASSAKSAPASAPQPSTRYILDGYADIIRTSIVDTTHGKAGEVAQAEPKTDINQPRPENRSGNLYSLLEKAGSANDQGAGGGAPAPPPAYEEPASYSDEPVEQESSFDSTEEDQRREEIRAKFLEAIRAAAERREASMDEE